MFRVKEERLDVSIMFAFSYPCCVETEKEASTGFQGPKVGAGKPVRPIDER